MSETVLFDLDGTLTDPKPGITRSIQYALRKFDAPVPETDELTWCIGPPLLSSLVSLLGQERAPQALAYYRERFADIGWQENRLYEGIIGALDGLSGGGARLFVATSKPTVYALRIVEHFGLARYFDEVFGSELDGTRADKADLLRYACEHTPSNGRATMIGDREHDIRGAIANGLETIGVSYGYGSVEELRSAGATRIVHSPSEILQALR